MKRTGQVTRLKNGKYQIRVQSKRADGTRKSVSQVIHGTRDDAKDALKTLLSDIAEKEKAKRPQTVGKTFNDLFDTYLEIKKPEIRLLTYENYERVIRVHLKPKFGQMLLINLEALDIEKFYTELLKTREASTVGIIHVILKGALKRARRWKWLVENPIEDISPPRVERKLRDVLMPEEINQFLAACPTFQTKLQWMFFGLTGCRASEVCGAKWKYLDLERQVFYVREVLLETDEGFKFGEPKTKKSVRNIDLADELVIMLKKHRREQETLKTSLADKWQDLDLVFPADFGKPQRLTNIGRSVESIKKLAGIDKHITPHSFRRSFGTLGRRLHLNRKAVSDVMGHATDNFTDDNYVFTDGRDRQIVANAIADAILGNVSNGVSAKPINTENDLLN